MCLELLYQNSISVNTCRIEYLAIDNEIIVKKPYLATDMTCTCDEDDDYDPEEHASYYTSLSGDVYNPDHFYDEDTGYSETCRNEMWLQFEDADNNKICTILLSYLDVSPVDQQGEWSEDNWNATLCSEFIDLTYTGHGDEFIDNVMDMIADGMHSSGLLGGIVKKKYLSVIDRVSNLNWRLVDFTMHNPTDSDPHPGYDT